MAIPIRNYPYTDYHDLNLDFLLRQFQQYEVDIEDLKRRVKALEDWREVAEPDINTLKNQMVQVLGDILLLQNRVTTTENNINILADNVKNYFIKVNNNDTVELREGSQTGTIIDLSDNEALEAFVDRCLNAVSTKGEKNDRFFMYYKGQPYKECDLVIRSNNEISFVYESVFNIGSTIKTFTVHMNKYTHTVSASQVTQGVRSNLSEAVANVDDWVASGDATYPYKQDISILWAGVFSSKLQVDLYFKTLTDFNTYSPILSEYMDVSDQGVTIYATEIPADTINMYAIITGGN